MKTARFLPVSLLLLVLFFQFLPPFVAPASAAANHAPVANEQSVMVNEDSSVGIVLTGSDPDGNTISYSISSQPNKGTLTCSGPQCLYTPTANINGTDFFNFKTSDGSLTSRAARVSITINAMNDAPTLNGASYTIAEDATVTMFLQGSDLERDSLTYQLMSAPSLGTATLNGSSITYTGRSNVNGRDSFLVVANDGRAVSAPATISVTINAVNDAPVANNQDYSMDEGTVAALSVNASDVDGDALTVSIGYAGTHLHATAQGNTVILSPDSGFIGADSFTYRVTDGSSYSGTASVNVTVNAVLDPLYFEVSSGGTVIENFLNNEAGSSLDFSIVTAPQHGTVTITAANTFSYEANSSYSGEDSFTFRSSNGSTQSSVATATIKVLAAGDYTPISSSALQSLNVSTTRSADKTVVTMDSDSCYHFDASPLILNGMGSIQYIVGTLFSNCLNYVEVPNYQFFVRSDTGEAFEVSSALMGGVEVNAYGASVFDGNTLVTPVASSAVDSIDSDAPTGGLFIQQFNADGSITSTYDDVFEGRGIFAPVLLVDDMVPASTLNDNSPPCQLHAKIGSEYCGIVGFFNALTHQTTAMVFTEQNGYEASYMGSTRAIMSQNGVVTYDRLIWGNGTGGNNVDSLNVGGGCRVNMVDKNHVWDLLASGDLDQLDFFSNSLSQVKYFDPGDAGCTDGANTVNSEDTMKSAIQKTVVGFDPSTRHARIWIQGYQPDVYSNGTDSEDTRINLLDENLNPVCDALLRSGHNKNPFNGANNSLVIDEDGYAYTNADVYDSQGILHTSIVKLSPTDCSMQTLLDFKVNLVGGSLSGLTLAIVGGNAKVLTSTPGYLHVFDLSSGADSTYTLGSSSNTVSAAPVVDNSGRVIVVDNNNVMTIFNTMGASYGQNFWPRPGHDNWGTNTAEIVLP